MEEKKEMKFQIYQWYMYNEKSNFIFKEEPIEIKIYHKVLDTYNKIQNHIQLIQTYTDDERILAQCNLILKEIEDE